MKYKTTEIKGIFVGGQLAIVMHRKNSFWIATYMSEVFRKSKGYDLFVHAKKFRTIKAIQAVFDDLGLIYEGNKTISLTMPSGRDSARSYAQSRKAFKNRKLAIWMTPDDFKMLEKVKKILHKELKIKKPTNELAVRFLINCGGY